MTREVPIARPPLARPPKRKGVLQRWLDEWFEAVPRTGLVMLSLLFLVSGCGLLNADRWAYDRFRGDNATGATANAVELLAGRNHEQAGPYFVAAVLCWMLIALMNIRRELRRPAN